MSFVLILFGILTLAAVAVALLVVHHVLSEYRKEKEHERELEEREQERVERLFEED